MIKRLLIVLSSFFVFAAAQAAAGNFTPQDVKNFIKVSEQLDGLEDRYPDADLGINTNDPSAFSQMIDENGNLIAYQRIMKNMPEGPARQEVITAIKGNGFPSTDKFTKIADSIIMAYMSIELGKQDMNGMDQMTPEMLAMMPPSVQEQMGPVIKLMSAAKNVPQEDKDTLAPHLADLEAVF